MMKIKEQKNTTKNKKGFVASILTAIIGIAAVVLILLALNGDVSQSEINNKLNWSNFSDRFQINSSADNSTSVITNVVYKSVDLFGYASFEIIKFAVDFGIKNPQIDYRMILLIMLLSFALPALYYLIILIALIVIFIKELVISRREKKELKRLKEKKYVERD